MRAVPNRMARGGTGTHPSGHPAVIARYAPVFGVSTDAYSELNSDGRASRSPCGEPFFRQRGGTFFDMRALLPGASTPSRGVRLYCQAGAS